MNLSLILQNLIFPILMIILGILDATIFAKNKELHFGYKSYRADLNNETWKYAQIWMGKTFIATGIIFSVLALLLALIKNLNFKVIYIFNIGLVVVTIISMFFLERKLKSLNNGD